MSTLSFYRKLFLFSLIVAFSNLVCGHSVLSKAPNWTTEVTQWVQNGGVYVEDEQGNELFNYLGDTGFMPASTMKLVTGLAAIELLGLDYRFKTEFYQNNTQDLFVKGYGDPFLVSEELLLVAKKLKGNGLTKVHDIILDESYFGRIEIPGASASLNPYDALNSSLSANFNTIFIQKAADGTVSSAETQTPMTELTRALASKAPVGKSRINLAAHPDQSLLYVGYLLKEFLAKEGVSVTGQIRKGVVSGPVKLFYTHLSSKDLKENVRAMMEFSTNFIANQLFLVIGAEKLSAPATLEKSQKVVTQFLEQKLKLKDFYIEEGSGLSRKNKISPIQLVRVLRAFQKYKDLLPEKLDGIVAKTGTLTGVASLAGFFDSATHKTVRFAILLNQSANHREKIAKLLYQYLQ